MPHQQKEKMMRELNYDEVKNVNGGLAPLVVAAIWTGGAAVVTAGIAAVSHLRSDDCTTTTTTSTLGNTTTTTVTEVCT